MTMQPADADDRFAVAVRRLTDEHSRDPNLVWVNGDPHPRELLYIQWLNDWLLKLDPAPSEALRLAAHSQHLCRWLIPRESYPMTRAGYLQWRQRLKRLHADKAGEVLREAGYPEETIARVQALNLKKDFPHDPDSRILEDALCLVFLEHQFAELASKTPEAKMLGILGKTWQKMTPKAHALARGLSYGEHEKALLAKLDPA